MRYVATLLPLMLGGYYVFVTEATTRSKAIVAVFLLVSFISMFTVPAYWLWSLLLQIGVGVYIAFYLVWKHQ